MKLNVSKFAKLARVKLTSKEEKKIGKDLSDILHYFKELEELDTKNVPPVIGGTDLENVFREDEPKRKERGDPTRQFPATKNRHLRVPKVFE